MVTTFHYRPACTHNELQRPAERPCVALRQANTQKAQNRVVKSPDLMRKHFNCAREEKPLIQRKVIRYLRAFNSSEVERPNE